MTKRQPSPIQRAAPTRGSPPLVLNVTHVGPHPDIGTVDALCRIALEARRSGCSVRLEAASPELRELVAFSGLASVLRSRRRGRHDAGRSEDRESVSRDQLPGVSQTG